MYSFNKSTTNSMFSAKLSNYSEQKFNYRNSKNLSPSHNFNLNPQSPKVQFRKVLKLRNNHSQINQDEGDSEKRMTESRYRRNSNHSIKDYVAKESQQIQQKLLLNQSNKNTILSQQQKNFRDSDKLQHFLREKEIRTNDSTSKLYRNASPHRQNSKTNLQKSKLQYLNVNSSIKKLNDEHSVQNIKIPSKTSLNTGQLHKDFRPNSSSRLASISKMKRHERKISDFQHDHKNQYQKIHFQNHNQHEHYTHRLENFLLQFQSIESKINSLISQKWQLIAYKLMKQKHNQNTKNYKSTAQHQNNHKISLQRLKNNQSPKMQEKLSFSRMALKNIDFEIMNQIKNLQSLDLNLLNNSQRHFEQNDKKQSIQNLEKRRAEIIEKVLAESMVESDLLKKNYSGQFVNGFSKSNFKVGQNNLKSKLILANNKNIIYRNKSPQEENEQIQQRLRESISYQSESKSKYLTPNQEDYEKYRYRHPEFHPNLQPLPRTSYKSHFFDYSNVQMYNPKYKEESSMIFPPTSLLKGSSYKDQFKQFSPERINYKDLDAYQNKFKQLDVFYLPKKRSESEAYSSRNGTKFNKFLTRLDFVKKLKTESIMSSDKQRELTQNLAPKIFSTETKNNYQNPQKQDQQFAKSQIKHKKLYALKYDMKKKFKI